MLQGIGDKETKIIGKFIVGKEKVKNVKGDELFDG